MCVEASVLCVLCVGASVLCMYVCMYPYVMDRHNDLLLGLMILTDFHVDVNKN